MKVLLTCGGTGGHINPAIAIANRIKAQAPGTEIAFVGTEKGMEASLVPKAGYPISFVKVRGFKRKLTLANIDAAIKAVTSVMAAKKIIRAYAPDVVIGTGGYVSWPTVRAAAKLGVPTLIQEQNAFPGVTQRMLSKYADVICVSFEESRSFFDESVQSRIRVTGNPVNVSGITRAQARSRLGLKEGELYVLSSGGSLGADKVNEYVFDLIGGYTGPQGIRHIHSVGRAGWEKYSRIASERSLGNYPSVEIREYIFDMPLHLAAADIVIGRAGAMTLAENAVAGKTCIFIPSPNVTGDHQYKNAKVLADASAAMVFRESDLTGEKLISAVKSLADDPAERAKMEQNIKKFARPLADREIAQAAIEIAGRH